MIHITCIYPGIVHLSGFRSGDIITLESSISVEKFLISNGIAHSHLKHIIPIVNGQDRHLDYVLMDQDILKLYIPVGGG